MKAQAVDGKANSEIQSVVSELLEEEVELVKGSKSKLKVFKIPSLSDEELGLKLESLKDST